jgi:hypothetical protein
VSVISVQASDSTGNPLDLVEEIVSSNEWAFDRPSERDLVVEFSGNWCDYRLYFNWVEAISAMQFSCVLDMKVPKEKNGGVNGLLSLINDRLWLGHFTITADQGLLAFRHAVLLRGMRGASVEQLEDLVDIALSEAERFYPAFQFVIWGGKEPHEAIEVALLDTVGEA